MEEGEDGTMMGWVLMLVKRVERREEIREVDEAWKAQREGPARWQKV